MEFVTNILSPLVNNASSITIELIKTYEPGINFIAALITIFGLVIPVFNWIFSATKSEPKLDLKSLEDEIKNLKYRKEEVKIKLEDMQISYGNILTDKIKIKRKLNYFRLWTICSTLAILISGFVLKKSLDKNEKINMSINNYHLEIAKLQDSITNPIPKAEISPQNGIQELLEN